jgi:trigger factor
LKIETQARDDHQTKLIAELDAETFNRFMQRAARKISREARIPGFRPGKAPYEVVRRIHGDQAIQQEAVELMLDEVYPTILEEAKIDPSGPGKLEEIVSLDPPTFSFVVPLPPAIELGDYLALRKDYTPEPITEEQIERTLRNVQRSYAVAEPVERPAEKGDLVSFKLSANRMNAAEGEPETLIAEGSYQLVAGEPEQPEGESEWPYAGFSEELIGMSASETKNWAHTFDETTTFEDLRGKEAEFKIEVESVKSLTLPELNEEFLKSIGNYETVEALREAIRTQLEQEYQRQYDQTYFDDLIGELVSSSSVKYPPHMLEEEMHEFLHGVEHNLEHDRLDLDTYLKMRQMDRETFMNEEVKPAASRRLERSLVLEEFARRENIEVKSDEIRSIYYAALQQMQQSSDLKKIQSQQKQSAREMANSIAANTVNNIFSQRLTARLKAIATGKGDEPVEEPAAILESEIEEAVEASETDEVIETPVMEEAAASEPTETESAAEAASETEAPAEIEEVEETSDEQSGDQAA